MPNVGRAAGAVRAVILCGCRSQGVRRHRSVVIGCCWLLRRVDDPTSHAVIFSMPDGPLNVLTPNLHGSVRDIEQPQTVAPDASAIAIRRRPNILACSALLALSMLLIWHRLWIWNGLAHLDVATFYMPWYAFLGDHLRQFHIPRLESASLQRRALHRRSQSGWMYLPAMVFFSILNPLAAYKAYSSSTA